MIATFHKSGIRFRYPKNWAIALEPAPDDDGGWTATIESPVTAFIVLSLRPVADTPALLADEALAALLTEYPDLEQTPTVVSLGGLPAVGFDVDFVTVDSTVECRILAVESPAGPLLVLTQVGDLDRIPNAEVLDAVLVSMVFDEELVLDLPE